MELHKKKKKAAVKKSGNLSIVSKRAVRAHLNAGSSGLLGIFPLLPVIVQKALPVVYN